MLCSIFWEKKVGSKFGYPNLIWYHLGGYLTRLKVLDLDLVISRNLDPGQIYNPIHDRHTLHPKIPYPLIHWIVEVDCQK